MSSIVAILVEKERLNEALARGKIGEALHACLNVLRLDPEDQETRLRAAGLFARAGRIEDAIKLYSRAASVFREKNEQGKAIATYKLILQLDPNHAEAKAAAFPTTARRPLYMPSAQPLERPKPQPDYVTPRMLERIPALALLDQMGKELLADALELRSVRAGQRLVAPGERSDSLMLLLTGSARAERVIEEGDAIELPGSAANEGGRIKTAEIPEHTFVNPLWLFVDLPEDETVTATQDSTVLVLPRPRFDELSRTQSRVRDVLLRAGRDCLLMGIIRRNPALRCLMTVNRAPLIDQCQVRSLDARVRLLRQGAPSMGLYVLLRGNCRVLHESEDGADEYPSLGEDDFFGETALLTQSPATETVETASSCIVLGLSKASLLSTAEAFPTVREELLRHGAQRRAQATERARNATSGGEFELM